MYPLTKFSGKISKRKEIGMDIICKSLEDEVYGF